LYNFIVPHRVHHLGSRGSHICIPGLRMRNVLVTGGAGFIGSNFVRYLLREEPDVHVVNLDALTYAGSTDNLRELPDPGRHTFVEGDICDGKLVAGIMHRHRIDTVVHFAAESHVDRSIHGPGIFVRTNVVGTHVLLEAAREYWLMERPLPPGSVRFHHISTDEVFGSLAPDEPAWNESSPYAPNSPYAASKAAADHLVRAYGHTYGLPYTLTNCSNNYGPYQFPEKLIPLTVLHALDGREIPVYGDGRQIRDWLYVDDHCRAVLLVLRGAEPGRTYNIGGGNQHENRTVVEMICDILDRLVPDSPHAPHRNLMRFVEDRPGHDRRYAMDSGRIRSDLGWEPAVSLETGLERTVAWYLDNLEWVENVRARPDFRKWVEAQYSGRETI